MKKTLTVLILIIGIQIAHSQVVLDFKTKNENNIKDRTMMLDILRANLYENYQQEFIFVVNHFKVSKNFAWFEGSAQRKDGKTIILNPDGEYDCCGVTSLFKKSNGKWYIAESWSFGTDISFYGIRSRFPDAPRVIFPPRGNIYDN
jgi:hypothetical protein